MKQKHVPTKPKILISENQYIYYILIKKYSLKRKLKVKPKILLIYNKKNN